MFELSKETVFSLWQTALTDACSFEEFEAIIDQYGAKKVALAILPCLDAEDRSEYAFVRAIKEKRVNEFFACFPEELYEQVIKDVLAKRKA